MYVFGRGYGADTISDTSGANRIKFLEGIGPEALELVKVGDDGELRIKGTEDKVVLKNYFYRDRYRTYQLEFADGTIATINTGDFSYKASPKQYSNDPIL